MKFPLSWWRRKNSTVYFSGQVGLRDGELVAGGFEAELRQVFENIRTVLAEANVSAADVIKVGVFLVNRNDYAVFNQIYPELFGQEPFPARTTVFVAGLPLGALVEIDLIAEE